ncbi:MAG: NAD(P)H-dependent glycerol-3-phosphate dehydrogenase [Firmicutes bacterium]|nr:NAD(P)H-dependent glycerol-3-phosphate dehydrogenase [Bacillota bacterium]
MSDSKKIAVLGAGSWGTALARHLSFLGHDVFLWSRRTALVEELSETRTNSNYLPGALIPDQLVITGDLDAALLGAAAIVYCVPSHSFREMLLASLPGIKEGTLIVNTAKGIEENTMLRMSQVFSQVAGKARALDYVTLSGPSHAEEVARHMPTAVVVASAAQKSAETAQDLFMGDCFRVYTNPDIIGVELGGALKNIIALGTGIVDGLNGSDNAKAALMTRGMAEITRLGVAMHANPLTFAGLAGIGDLIVTCTSMHSRNRRAGIEIGRGKELSEVLKNMHMVVEGVRTTGVTHELAAQWGVEMPITEQVYQVLFNGLHPAHAVKNLLTRTKTHEVEEVALTKINVSIKSTYKS